jgi:hypothetical protein
VDPRGTLAETYLNRRGLTLLDDAPLRFHPRCPRGAERLPAMLALMTDPATGEARGVHRTFLAPDGAKARPGPNGEPSKMMIGCGGIVRLVPDDDVTLGLGVAEGIETALAVMQRAGWSPVWATGSAGGMAGFPVLPGIVALTLFADADDKGAGLAAAEACARRWRAAGREARNLAPPGGLDFEDATRGGAA